MSTLAPTQIEGHRVLGVVETSPPGSDTPEWVVLYDLGKEAVNRFVTARVQVGSLGEYIDLYPAYLPDIFAARLSFAQRSGLRPRVR